MAKTENHSIDIESRDEQNASFAKSWSNILSYKLLQNLYIVCHCEQIRVLLIPNRKRSPFLVKLARKHTIDKERNNFSHPAPE